MVIQGKTSPLEFLPVQVFLTLAVLFHGYAVFYRANQFAEITAHTFFFLNCIRIIGLAICQVNGLMRSVLAGDIAQSTMYAFILIDLCDDMIIDVKVLPVSEG